MKNALLIVLAAFLIAAGPKVSNKKSAAPPKAIWPLKNGNTWIYKVTINDDKGTKTSERFDTMSVLNDVLVGSDLFYKVQTVQSSDGLTYTEFFMNRDDGFYSYGENKEKARYLSYFKYPGVKGDTMKIGKDNMLIESIDDNVKTPAGSFNCYKYILAPKGGQSKNVFYFSAGQGLISSESYKKNILTYKRELISLKIK